jgi:hypothetical protein
MYRGKKYQKLRFSYIFSKTAQSKQPHDRLKFAQSGHPDFLGRWFKVPKKERLFWPFIRKHYTPTYLQGNAVVWVIRIVYVEKER